MLKTSSLLAVVAVCFLCFSRGIEASTSVTIVTTSSTTTTTTKTDPTSTDETPAQPLSEKCPSITSESVPAAQKTGSIQEKFLHFSVDPMTITEGSTDQLTINCTFWAKPGAKVSNIGIIGIYRIRDLQSTFGLDKQEVAAVSGPGIKEPITIENLSITRHVNKTGLSYLNLTISSPTSKDEGLYRCTVIGTDTHKEPFLAQATSQVGPRTTDQPGPSKEFAPTSPPQTDSTMVTNGVALAQFKTKIESMQLAFDNIRKQVLALENFQTNVNARLANIKSSLFLNPLEKEISYVISQTDFTSYTAAQATCEIFGGFLAEVDDLDEYKMLTEFVGETFEGEDAERSNTEVEGLLIGGTFNEQDSQWSTSHNINNSPYFNWKDGIQPADPTKKCVVLLKDANWDMTDQACRNEKSHFRFMCEIPRGK